MAVSSLVQQFGGSLLAILVLAGLAWLLRLGGQARLSDESAARRAAEEVWDGFEPVAIALDQNGAGALLRDAAGRIMVIRRHGNRFVGRILTERAQATIAGEKVHVDSGEPGFGRATLALSDSKAWADAINRVSEPGNA